MQIKTCPRCKSAATELIDVDTGMRLLLQKSGQVQDLPSQVCSVCYNSLTSQVSHGAKLRLEQKAKEKNRHMVWKSRVNLIKHARQMMQQKAYSEAAVSYEKYLRVLEISYDLKPGALNPTVFGKSSRSKELTVIATTYWDLLRIYDTSPKYRDRMRLTAKKLAEFIPYSPLFTAVIKQAQSFATTAKNPDIVKEFLKLSKARASRCFVASAAFSDPYHPVVVDLRIFRDETLATYRLGRVFIQLYYFFSPPIATAIDRMPFCKRWLQVTLQFIRDILFLFR